MGLTASLAAFSYLPLGILSTSSWTGILIALVYLVVILVGQGVSVVLALKMPSLHPPDVGDVPRPISVSVIIPARNEEECIGDLLDDLAKQDFTSRGGGSMEIIVVDGASSDGTAEVARRHGIRPLVVEEPPLPSGWVGKNWGCETGQKVAKGELLLFLDADVRLSPEAVRAAAVTQINESADMVTFAARVVMDGFWEHAVLPLYTQFVLTYFRPHRVNRKYRREAMANGQFMLMSREGYSKVGGHASIRGYVLEDVRMAQRVKEEGGNIRIAWTPEMVTTRMYADTGEMYEGISKNIAGTSFSLARQLFFVSALFLLFLSPFVVLALSLIFQSLIWLSVSLIAITLTTLKQAAFQNAIRAPPGYALTYPLAICFYLAMLGRSIRVGLTKGSVTWKGREYPVVVDKL